MGSATRSAREAARQAVASTAGADRHAGEQMLAVARVIDASPGLQSALVASDSSASGVMRDRVFAELSGSARSVLDAALSQSWSSTRDLVAGIEELGIRVIAATAADAETVARELHAVGALVADNAELELALSGTRGTPETRGALIDALLDGKTTEETRAIIGHLVRAPRGRRIGELVRTGAELVADESGRGLATVTVARPLTDAQTAAVAATVRERYGRDHLVVQVVDPTVVGGVRIQVGYEVIDGSIAARLTDLTLQLAR